MTTMNDSSGYQQGRSPAAYPQQPNGQPPRAPEADAPDFMLLAAGQLRQVINGIEARVKTIRDTQHGDDPEWYADVRAARLAVADRLIALAEIQYAIPDDGGDPGDEDEGEGDYPGR